MATRKINLVFPKAEEFVKEKEVIVGDELSDIRGKRIALVDNGRPNANIAFSSLRDILEKDYACEVFISSPRISGQTLTDLSPDICDHIASQADAAVVGVAT